LWRKIKFYVKPGFEDIASMVIFESGFCGLLESSGKDDIFFEAFYRISPEQKDSIEQLKELIPLYSDNKNDPIIEIKAVEDIPLQDWEFSWREGLSFVETGKKLVVRPSWVPYDNKDNRTEIIIDPKMAFGTGGHSTTKLCLEMMEYYNVKGSNVLDAGCGSGVLSIAAAKLGAEKVYGFDNDPFSVENAIENIKMNGVDEIVSIEPGDLDKFDSAGYDYLTANLISGVIKKYAFKFKKALLPDSTAIFSGILADEREEMTSVLSAAGFRIDDIKQLDEWIAFKTTSE